MSMKTSTITTRLDDAFERGLITRAHARVAPEADFAREPLRRRLALLRFERVRRRALPLAESQGYLMDEGVFRDVS